MEFENKVIGLKNIKSVYFIQKIFVHFGKVKSLLIVNYNKKLQNLLKFNFNDYKDYSELFSPIEIELTVAKDKHGQFINIENDNYFHVYFNDNKKEQKKDKIDENEKVNKIKVIIDYQINSLNALFKNCECIESIIIKKFYRNNIINMKDMFYKCLSLKEVDFISANTINVTDMYAMLYECV